MTPFLEPFCNKFPYSFEAVSFEAAVYILKEDDNHNQ